MSKVRKIDPRVKFYPSHLMEKLDFSISYPVTLIEAPSGFGKTTLLEHFLEAKLPLSIPRWRYCFHQGEGLHVWEELCEKLGQVDPRCGERLSKAGPPRKENLPQIGEALEQLCCPCETFLWLDNYKFWNDPFSAEFLELLCHHGGEKLHIIISTQPLSRPFQKSLAQNGQIWRLQEEDLSFTKEDIAAYFLTAGIPLSHAQVEEVYALTEGWVMALCLQMRSFVQRGRFEDGDIMELMEHVVWEELSPIEQSFLLKISIFPRFNLAQADAFSFFDPEETDRMLRENRYFIHYDPEGRFFYPHTQLRRLLEEHFARLSEDEKNAIYLQGARLAEQMHDRRNTIRFYHAAGKLEKILELPATNDSFAHLSLEDMEPIILDLFEHSPREAKLSHPDALISLAYGLFLTGKTEILAHFLQEIDEIIRDCSLSPPKKRKLLGELEMLRSLLEFNRIPAMNARNQRALELLGGPAELVDPHSLWTFGSPSILYLLWRESGKLDQELQELEEAIPLYCQLTRGHGSGAELLFRAEAHLLRGELEDALPLCYQALFVANSHHQDSIYQCGLFLLCRLDLQSGNFREMDYALNSLRERSALHREDLSRYTLDLAESYLSLLQGEDQNVADWLSQGEITSQRLIKMVQPMAYVIYGRCLLLSGEFHKLLGVSQYFLDCSAVFPNLLPQVYAHIYCSEALDALGRQQEALERLEQALALAMPDRLYLPFAENISGIRHLLPMTSLHEAQRERILSLSPPYCAADTQSAVSSFTPRERSIHYLVKEGLTNKEIAQKLLLSPNTVRNILSGMLKKKGVSSRAQLRELPEE